jgi:integrase
MIKGSGNGWFRTKKGKKLYCWYNDAGDERSRVIGGASLTDAEGWLVVADLKLNQEVGRPDPKNATFGEVMNHWLAYGKTKTGEDKDDSTKVTDERNARNHLSHWADHVTKDMEPWKIQQWLDKKSKGLRSKLKNTMSAIFMHGLKFGLIPRGPSGEIDKYNPMKLVSAPCKSDFESVELSGVEAATVIRCISDPLVKVLVILIAVTGMRISEALALPWDAIDWAKGKIRIRRKWNGKSYGKPKSRMSRKPVEMTKGLATVLEVWRQETMYAKDEDLLFPSYRKQGKQPRLASMLVEDYIRPSAISSRVLEVNDGECYYDGELVERFGFHSLRHGLGTWLAENGTSPEVIQRMLRHSSKDMTMHYIHAKAREAQEKYIAELGIADVSQPSDSGCSLRVQ